MVRQFIEWSNAEGFVLLNEEQQTKTEEIRETKINIQQSCGYPTWLQLIWYYTLLEQFTFAFD